jgi:pimeloyl-ACP methyl ester carboxylesterase
VGYGWRDEWSALKDIESVHNVLPRTIDHDVEALSRLLIQAKISDPIVLVGHSYEGPISLAFEAKYPDRVMGLVLLDPHDDGVAFEDQPYTKEINAGFIRRSGHNQITGGRFSTTQSGKSIFCGRRTG